MYTILAYAIWAIYVLISVPFRALMYLPKLRRYILWKQNSTQTERSS